MRFIINTISWGLFLFCLSAPSQKELSHKTVMKVGKKAETKVARL